VLEREAPEIPVLSEEGAHLPFETRRGWRRLWVVDPLDGTKEFLSRNGEFTVNVALVDDGVPRLGVVGVPVLDSYYIAGAELGAFRLSRRGVEAALRAPDIAGALAESGRQLTEPQEREQDIVRVVASRSHLNEKTEAFISALEEKYGSVELVQSGSAVKLCRVAEGAADYYPRLAPTMEWDTAAGHAVVREAGGRVLVADETGNADRTELQYNKEDLHNPFFVAVGRGIEL
jgi:3'(2'), 5'-bisphosphate nucleotidase